jgi:hypothetical protein
MRRRVPCEQQLDMGQSVLSGRRKPTEKRWIDVFYREAIRAAKGNPVNIPEPRQGDVSH